MTFRIDDFDRVEALVEKNQAKHGIEPWEAEVALLNTDPKPYIRKVANGKYMALCQIEEGGDYLVVVFAMPLPRTARVISARTMDSSERAEYQRRREGKQNR